MASFLASHTYATYPYSTNTTAVMNHNILAFGIIKEIFGSSKIEMELNNANADTLRKLLEEKMRKKEILVHLLRIL